jgi:hypothetical protein
MCTSDWTPSIARQDADRDVYLVEVDLDHWGRVWTEADSGSTDLETLLSDMLAGQRRNPVRVIAFNTAEGWSRDVSADIAIELRRRCDLQQRDIPATLQNFVHRHPGDRSQLSLPQRLVRK